MFDQMGSMDQLYRLLGILLIATFFITSADSATFVLGMLTTHISLNPPNRIKMVLGYRSSRIWLHLIICWWIRSTANGIAIIAAFPFVLLFSL